MNESNEITPEQAAELKRNLAEFESGQTTTASGSEMSRPDLENFEIDPELYHLYERATIENIGDQPVWMVIRHEYMILQEEWKSVPNPDGSPRTKEINIGGEKVRVPIGIQDKLNNIINGPQGYLSKNKGWKVAGMFPGTTGGVAILERLIRHPLESPVPVKTETAVEDVRDEELKQMDKTAKDWISKGEEHE